MDDNTQPQTTIFDDKDDDNYIKSLNHLDEGLLLSRQNRELEAVEEFKQALAYAPNVARVYYHWGNSLNNLTKYDDAIERYKKAVEIQKDFPDAYINLGNVYYRQGKYNEAVDQYRLAAIYQPEYALAYRNAGLAFNHLGEDKKAIEQFELSAKYDPNSADTFYNWGTSYTKQKEFDKAIVKFEQSLKENPDFANAYFAWGNALINSGNYQEAIEKYKTAAEKYEIAANADPGNAVTYYYWGVSLYNIEQYDAAVEILRKAVENKPNYIEAIRKLGSILLKLKKCDQAHSVYDDAIDSDPENAHLYHREKGQTFTDQEKYTEAIEQYGFALEKSPADGTDDDLTLNYWGWTLEKLEDYAGALEKYKQGIEESADLKYFYHSRCGWVYNRLELFDEAIVQFKKALEIKADYIDGYFGWGYTLTSLKRYDESNEMYRKAIDVDNSYIHAYHNIANNYQIQGQYKEAKKWWALALDLYQSDVARWRARLDKNTDHFLYLGYIHQLFFNNYEEAERFYEEGLSIDPDHTDLLIRLVDLLLEKEKEITELSLLARSSQKLQGRYLSLKEGLNKQIRKKVELPPQVKANSILQANEIYRKANKRLNERLAKKREAVALYDLGNLYYKMEDFETAEKHLQESIRLMKDNEALIQVHNVLGLVYLGQDNAKAAVKQFTAARNLGSDDLSVMSNLAKAYFKAELLDLAEVEYQKIFRITEYHVDALIGLGEVYTAMGDSAKEGNFKADPSEMYFQARNFFTRAITLGGPNAKEREKSSKLLKGQKLAAAYYLRGYVNVALYESQLRRDTNYLRQARSDFDKIPKTDPKFHKASRAKNRINERISFFAPQNFLEKAIPWLVSIFALLIFVGATYFFLIGRSTTVLQPIYRLDDQIVNQLASEEIAAGVVDRLAALGVVELQEKEAFLETINGSIEENLSPENEQLLLNKAAGQVPVEINETIDPGVFAVLAFGSFIFMIAGPYLQQISRLKFAGLEIEKASVDQGVTTDALEISR